MRLSRRTVGACAQNALDTNSGELDNALTDLGNSVDDGAAKRAAAQAKVDAATQKDALLRSQLLSARAGYESLGAQCKTELGTRSLTAACQGVLGEASLIMASIQTLLATDDQMVDLGRQIVTQFDRGNYNKGNALIDQHNSVVDTANANSSAIGARVDNFQSRVDACTASH